MNEVKIRYSKNALKFLDKTDKNSVARIRAAIAGLACRPPVGDIKPLQGYDDGRMRLRVGQWRVIYRRNKEDTLEIIFIIDIGNRGDIYK